MVGLSDGTNLCEKNENKKNVHFTDCNFFCSFWESSLQGFDFSK